MLQKKKKNKNNNNNKAKKKQKYNRSLENISRPGVEPWQYQSDTCLFWFSFFKL